MMKCVAADRLPQRTREVVAAALVSWSNGSSHLS